MGPQGGPGRRNAADYASNKLIITRVFVSQGREAFHWIGPIFGGGAGVIIKTFEYFQRGLQTGNQS